MSRDSTAEKWCPSCRMRYRLGDPPRRDFHQIGISAMTFSYLMAAALEFDETAQALTPDEMYTAVDFCDWIRGSLVEKVV